MDFFRFDLQKVHFFAKEHSGRLKLAKFWMRFVMQTMTLDPRLICQRKSLIFSIQKD